MPQTIYKLWQPTTDFCSLQIYYTSLIPSSSIVISFLSTVTGSEANHPADYL